MRSVLAAIVIGAVTIAVAWWVAGIGGTVSATIAGITVQTTAPVALLALAVLVIAVHLALRLLSGLAGLSARSKRMQAARRRVAGDRAVTKTLVALAASDAAAARSQASRARRLLGDTPQTLLHAAEAARLAGRDEEAAALYRRLSERADAGFLGVRGLFRQAVARQDWAAATTLVGQAEALRPGTGWLRTERAELAVRTGNWQQAIALSAPGAPTAAYAVAAAEAEPNLDRAIRMAGQAWKQNPGFSPAALAYLGKLRLSGRESRVQAVLRDVWRQSPHPDVAAFALGDGGDPAQRLQIGARLAQANPGHPESLFLIARLAMAAGRPEEARRNAEAARNAGMNQQRLWKLVSEIDAEEHGGQPVPTRDALRLASSVEPDPGWRCEACGTMHGQWMAVCPTCQTPGRIVWTAAARPRLTAS